MVRKVAADVRRRIGITADEESIRDRPTKVDGVNE